MKPSKEALQRITARIVAIDERLAAKTEQIAAKLRQEGEK